MTPAMPMVDWMAVLEATRGRAGDLVHLVNTMPLHNFEDLDSRALAMRLASMSPVQREAITRVARGVWDLSGPAARVATWEEALRSQGAVIA